MAGCRAAERVVQRVTEHALVTLGRRQRGQLVRYLGEIRRNLEAATAADHRGNGGWLDDVRPSMLGVPGCPLAVGRRA